MTLRQDAKAVRLPNRAEAARVLVASDDLEARSLLEFALQAAGFAVETAVCATLLDALVKQPCQLLLVDIDVRDSEAMSVCEQVRQISTVPMLVLINQSNEQALLQVMEAGADCYVVRPFSVRTLIARVKAMLRRAASIDAATARYIEVGAYRLDVEAHTLQVDNTPMQLTRLEAATARVLMQNVDQPVSNAALIAEVWSTFSRGNRNMLKQIVFRLRRKLASDAPFSANQASATIVTTDGGYMWQAESHPNLTLSAARETRVGK